MYQKKITAENWYTTEEDWEQHSTAGKNDCEASCAVHLVSPHMHVGLLPAYRTLLAIWLCHLSPSISFPDSGRNTIPGSSLLTVGVLLQ